LTCSARPSTTGWRKWCWSRSLKSFAAQVEAHIDGLLTQLPRADTARAALANSRAVIVASEDEAVDAANAYASEHLIVQTSRSTRFL
jgi:histidinol dehydrogenase